MITNQTKIFNVRFNTFDIEKSGDCSRDWLQIHDGNSLTSQLIGRYCGKNLPFDGDYFQTSQEFLLFWFRSDNQTQGRGFNISWYTEDYVCGGRIHLNLSKSIENLHQNDGGSSSVERYVNENGGIIRSPGYPGKTPRNRNCEWEIFAPYKYRLVIQIFQVVLGSSGEESSSDKDCRNGDSLTVTIIHISEYFPFLLIRILFIDL